MMFAALEFGTSLLRTVIFEERRGSAVPIVRKKLILEFPAGISSVRRVTRLREFLFGLVKEMERVPERIAISLEPPLGVYAIEEWKMKLPSGTGRLSRRDLSKYFQNLFRQNNNQREARIAYPLRISLNGYPLVFKEATLLAPPSAELAFYTFVFTLDLETGAGLAEAKRSLGGMPIEFVPLPVALETAITRGMGFSEALFLLSSGQESVLFLIKDGSLAEAVPFSYNGFKAEFDIFYPLGPLPKTLLLGGVGAGSEELRVKLKSVPWMKDLSQFEAPDIRVADPAAFFGGDTLGGALRGTEETGLGALIYWILYHEPIF